MPHSSDQLRELVRLSLGLPAGDRDGYLAARLAGQPANLAAARNLLNEQLAGTIAEVPEPFRRAPKFTLPERLGAYRILDILGEGGMGVVYLAEQDRPRRTVALKLIRPGLLTPRIQRRFEVETQTLGRLQHPGIAQVYEAGTLGDGTPESPSQPFFAMERVEGRTLFDFAVSESLDTRARLRLFIEVCDAVQHAHQRGVIHRDLKPSNILVTREGRPKILDFGVAKLADADPGRATMATEAGQVVGTVPYMSPEQITGRGDDVDTRSDVYTLGVILFEMLAGRLPYAVGGRTLYDASHIIATEDAPRLGSITPSLRGDLEVVIAKAMDKDRQQRYQSPADLAAELQRYLDDQPILARRASTVYHLRKFARRNKPLVAGVGVGLVILVIGAAGIVWQAVEATRGRALAERMRIAAETESKIAHQVNLLLTDTLQSADPDVSLGRELTVVEALDRTTANLESTTLEPRVSASVRGTLAGTYQSLSKLAQAEEQAAAALELYRQHTGDDSSETLEAMRLLAGIYADQGRFREAEPISREVVATLAARHGEQSGLLVPALVDLSRVLHESGQLAAAVETLDRAIAIGRIELGERDASMLFAMHNMASSLKDLGSFDEAVAMFRRVIELRREVLGASHSQTLSSMNNLAGTLQKAGRNEDALAMFREVLAVRERVFGADHASTLTTRSNIGVCLISLKRLDEAEPIVRSALAGYTTILGEQHTKTLITMGNLAFLQEDRGNDEDAEALYRRIVDIRAAHGRPGDPELLSIRNNLAMLLHRRGKLEEADAAFAELVALAETHLPRDNYITAIFQNNYGDCQTDLGRYDHARTLLTNSLETLRKTFPAEHPRVQKALARLQRLDELVTTGRVAPTRP